jgi:quercetin dioxygenase-like cupin family protein
MVRLRNLSVRLPMFGLVLVSIWAAGQQPRTIDPTFLHRYLPEVAAKPTDETTDSCRYKALFGVGDVPTPIVRGVARFGEMTIVPGGSCKPVSYPAEEQVYVIMEGSGVLHYEQNDLPVKKHDFMYLPAGVKHALANPSPGELRFFVMGFKLAETPRPPAKPLIATFDDIQKQVLSSHPDSVTYQLLMGDVNSKRDRLAAGHLLTSLYVMEFAPEGTNFPHHHDA